MNVWWYLAYFFLEWEMFQTKIVEKIKPHILRSVPLFPKILLFYEVGENMVHPDRPQMTI